jgi:hypothetical protein
MAAAPVMAGPWQPAPRTAAARRWEGPFGPCSFQRDRAVSVRDRNPSALACHFGPEEARVHSIRQEVPTG